MVVTMASWQARTWSATSRLGTAARSIGTLGALGGAGWLLRPHAQDLAAALGNPQRYVDTRGADALALLTGQLMLTAFCCWAALLTALWWAATAHGSPSLTRASLRLTPASWRTPIAVALGLGALTLTACGAPPSNARADSSTPAAAYAASSDAFDWPADTTAAAPDESAPLPTPPVDAAPPHTVVVEPGGCLWSIAAAELGPGADLSEIAYLVDAIYAENAAAIGDNPDLLLPGATITIPRST